MLEGQYLPAPEPNALQPPRLRDIVAAGSRHKRLLAFSFSGILLAAALAALLSPTSYEAHLKLLVKNERADPVVSAEPNAPPPPVSEAAMQEALNSEVELLKSEDLMQKVVIATGLDRMSRGGRTEGTQQRAVVTAARKLGSDLKVEPVLKTDLIRISYKNSQPKTAAQVLNTLADLYIAKHIEVHHTSGQYGFFSQLAEGYRQKLLDAEAKLADSGRASPHLMRDLTAEKYNDFTANLAQTKAAIKETEERIGGLTKQQKATPPRIITQTRRSDNQALLQQLKSTLLTLDLKRTELLAKYQPTYRPVQEVEKQIANTRAAIEKEENAPAREQTTDENPTRTWINSELAKARADLAGLKAREAATEHIVSSYATDTEELEKQRIIEDDQQRAVKTAEQNYLLYVRKAEEARISEALDHKRILNVAVAEPAQEPLFPSHSRFRYLVLGFALALVGSAGLVFAAEYLDSSYRTPDEVTRSLQLPVLAAIPQIEGHIDRKRNTGGTEDL